MTYYIINLRVLCIGKNNYLFGSAPPYEFFLIVCVCVGVPMCRQSVLDHCARGRSPNLSGDSVPVWLGERARDRSGDQGTSLIRGRRLGGDQGTSLIRGTRAGFTMIHSNRGRSPNNITALLFRPLIPCPIRKIFSTNLPNFCSEISGDFYP
jgi:hypothetical protein